MEVLFPLERMPEVHGKRREGCGGSDEAGREGEEGEVGGDRFGR